MAHYEAHIEDPDGQVHVGAGADPEQAMVAAEQAMYDDEVDPETGDAL